LKSRIPESAWLFLKIAATAAALYFVFARIDGNKLLEAWGGLSLPPLLAALALFVLSKMISAVRLNLFLKASGMPLGEAENMKLYHLGMFYNTFLPGGIGGDGYKVYILKKRFRLPAGRIVAAVAADRVLGVHALFVLAVLFFYGTGLEPRIRPWAWISLPASYGLLAMVVHKLWGHFRAAAAAASLLSLVVQACQLGTAWLIMLALGMHAREAEYLVLFLVSSLVAVLPVTVGGAGSREVAFLLGARHLGLDADLAISLSLTFYGITLLVSLLGAVFVFRPPLGEPPLGEPPDARRPEREVRAE